MYLLLYPLIKIKLVYLCIYVLIYLCKELTVSVTYENSVSLEFNDILCSNLPINIVAGEGLIIIDSYS